MTVENNHRWPTPNHNYVPEFQMSGVPYVITKTLPASANNAAVIVNVNNGNYKVSFDQVTRWLIVRNIAGNATKHLRVYFNATAAKTAYSGAEDPHYYLIDENEQSFRLEMKCKEVYLVPDIADKSFNVCVIAGLTNVPSNTFPAQTKANGFTGVEN
jgi:hypothetical protein